MQYTVKTGDTLYKIAKHYGIALDELIAANPQIKDPNSIMPGDVITIPKDEGEKPKPGNDCICLPDKEMYAKVCLNIPYPEIKINNPNVKYAKMLLDILADRSSELTAIHKYLYYYTILEETEYEKLAELLEAVSIIEMKHMHDTMEFIRLLGCEPMYENAQGKPWCATYVNYELHNICNLLMDIIQDEEMAAKLYRDTADYIKCEENLSEWLRRAAKDEEHHANLFTKYYKKYCKPMG